MLVSIHRFYSTKTLSQTFIASKPNARTSLKRLGADPYQLSQSCVQSLKLLSQVNLSLDHGKKNLILSAPHTGSTRLITKTCLALGQEIGADIQIIDYQSVLRTVSELHGVSTKEKCTN
jgi:hypothetical protein